MLLSEYPHTQWHTCPWLQELLRHEEQPVCRLWPLEQLLVEAPDELPLCLAAASRAAAQQPQLLHERVGCTRVRGVAVLGLRPLAHLGQREAAEPPRDLRRLPRALPLARRQALPDRAALAERRRRPLRVVGPRYAVAAARGAASVAVLEELWEHAHGQLAPRTSQLKRRLPLNCGPALLLEFRGLFWQVVDGRIKDIKVEEH
mmetsp:Transcript_11332/g.31883  ORF Transcript_11332/g.31883 Transcript_11332/m.31883 type:complete len:203 (+) Transcript_11332:1982-2590(+)